MGAKKYKPELWCYAFPCPPVPELCPPICNNVCGNIYLDSPVTNLEIWKAETSRKVIITLSVFSSFASTSTIKVRITRNFGNCVELMVSPGNTASATVDNVKLITVSHENKDIVEGKYCFSICVY
ncbi:S-Ena type endospore appendage [Bacillus cereus]|uniref:Endospore appendages core domain-containing protein n=1 Tax=Bacillus cereus HuA2-1 TaxID=1053201 RepID=J8YHS8_BACCE|nr:hypothetical protein IG3_03465 [Bacillus cereus HuA2-1]